MKHWGLMMTQTNPPPEGFKTCEVTGEVLPADSMVQFQGKWVGPKGKQILLERLQSGEPTEAATLQRPSFWRRFGCIFLDWLVLIIPTAALEWVFGVVSWTGLNPNAQPAFAFSHGILFAGLSQMGLFILTTAYFGILQGRSGQTLGKRAGREKVVRLDGNPVGMRTGILRGAYYAMPGAIMAIGLLTTVAQIFAICYVVSMLWSLTEIICLLADTRMQRALHDRLAGTRVILLP